MTQKNTKPMNPPQKDYEILFIYSSTATTFEFSKQKVESLFTEHKVSITKEIDMGVQDLQHVIKHNTKGHYYSYMVKLDPSKVQLICKDLRLQEDLLRFIVVHLDKHAMAFKARRKKEKAAETMTPSPNAEEETEAKVNKEEVRSSS